MSQEFFIGILAGGKSERFGMNKALFEIEGIPILFKILLEIPKLKLVPKMNYISCYNKGQWLEIMNYFQKNLDIEIQEENTDTYQVTSNKFNLDIQVEIVYDIPDNGLSEVRASLKGLHSIFKTITENFNDGFVQIIPCDMPHFNSKIIDISVIFCQNYNWNLNAAILIWENSNLEPLNSIYRAKHFYSESTLKLSQKNYRLREMILNQSDIQFIPIEKQFGIIDPTFKAFQNYNSRP